MSWETCEPNCLGEPISDRGGDDHASGLACSTMAEKLALMTLALFSANQDLLLFDLPYG